MAAGVVLFYSRLFLDCTNIFFYVDNFPLFVRHLWPSPASPASHGDTCRSFVRQRPSSGTGVKMVAYQFWPNVLIKIKAALFAIAIQLNFNDASMI